MAEKMIVVCNGVAPSNVMPALIFASSGIALDYEVHMFFCPAGAQALVKGDIRRYRPELPDGSRRRKDDICFLTVLWRETSTSLYSSLFLAKCRHREKITLSK